jgi:hypothetical protein
MSGLSVLRCDNGGNMVADEKFAEEDLKARFRQSLTSLKAEPSSTRSFVNCREL